MKFSFLLRKEDFFLQKGLRSYIFVLNFKNMKDLRNIIFDLGGVLFDINYQNIIESFRKLGLSEFDAIYTQLKQDHLFDELEKGLISGPEFRDRIRSLAKKEFSDRQIDDAWNSILIGFPSKNVDLLQELKTKYRLFLLSNTNEIHEKAFRKMLNSIYKRDILGDAFEKIYLSHHIHERKPDLIIFERVIRENNLEANHTLFIDDSPQHVEGAKVAGLNALLLKNGEWVGDLLKREIDS
ncbi:MAG TPA: HAD family phosphatase [Bacteroidia bacterium]|nr:HAD family phosphatase [Bacteroidia bacterium]